MPLFRDSFKRFQIMFYVLYQVGVCIYLNPAVVLRVVILNTFLDRSVTMTVTRLAIFSHVFISFKCPLSI